MCELSLIDLEIPRGTTGRKGNASVND
jgi:hypothetical protein